MTLSRLATDQLSRLAADLTRKYFPQTLAIGMRCLHPNGHMVEITDGQYIGTHGLSNFWYWRRVFANGKLSSKLEHGYGWDPNTVITSARRRARAPQKKGKP